MSNSINRFLLWCFLLPSGIYRKFGADINQLKAILSTKLTIDDRTATGLYKARQQSSDEDTSIATLITMVISLIMGLLFLFVFAIQEDLTRMTFYFSIFGFTLAMFLITDFSHILIDVKDNYIILPKPVTSQTFLLSRLLHIVIHVTKILVPMTLPAFVGIWISRGVWGAIVFIPIVMLLTLLTFALVNAVYLMIMRLFTPSKINSIITGLQIAFTVILYGSFQLLSRMMGESFLEQIDLSHYVWTWVFPSFWLAAGWKFLYSFSSEPVYLIGMVLSVVVPLLATWIMIRFLAPAFFRKLSMISASAEGEVKGERKGTNHHKGSEFLTRVAGLFTRHGIEKESFIFIWNMTSRNREFKLKVYPQVGYMLVLVVVFLFGGSERAHMFLDGELTPQLKFVILTFVYLSCVVFMGALFQLPYYQLFRASWIFYSPPLARPGLIIRGAIKACLVKFYLPVVIFLLISSVILFGPVILPNIIFGLGNVFLACTLYAWVLMDRLPFSVNPKMASEGQATFRTIFMLIALPLFGLPHYFLFDFPMIVSCISVLTITAGYMVLRYTGNISWGYMKEV